MIWACSSKMSPLPPSAQRCLVLPGCADSSLPATPLAPQVGRWPEVYCAPKCDGSAQCDDSAQSPTHSGCASSLCRGDLGVGQSRAILAARCLQGPRRSHRS